MRQKLIIRDDIIVDLPNGPIGISFSGGVESSLLVYLVLSQLKSYPVHLFTVSVDFRDFNQHIITSQVLQEICRITNNFNVYQHITVGRDDSIINRLFETPKDFILNHKIVKSLLAGGNANPPNDIIKHTKFFVDGKGPMNNDRDPTVVRSIKCNPYLYAPLCNLNKQDIIQLYKDNKIDKNILPLTQSCWAAPPCGDCWFCFERSWGMQILE
jgi:hypothetical protein